MTKNPFDYYIIETIKYCKKTSKPDEIDKKCEETFKQLRKIINDPRKKINNRYKKIHFFILLFESYLLFMQDNDNGESMLLAYIISLQRKLRNVLSLMEINDFESALIIYRSFYEGIIIATYLVDNISSDSLSKFYDLSVIRLVDAFNINTPNWNSLYNDLKKNYSNVFGKRQSYDEDNLEYGWAANTINKDKVILLDILREAYKGKTTNYKEMKETLSLIYNLSSQAIHSNNIELSLNSKLLESAVFTSFAGFALFSMENVIFGLLKTDSEKIVYGLISKFANKELWEPIKT